MLATTYIHTTKKGQVIRLQLSPKKNRSGRITVDHKVTDARFHHDDTIEDGIFLVTSSSPIQDADDAAAIATNVLRFLNSAEYETAIQLHAQS